ncbi:type II secretion system protein [Butyrivibrio sp. MC2013]|uniref:type II secretion system protein n=1 Tax=Butyrivibrio sp. MC2013 TaxID=1280686 RepID=UPI0004051740|nr:type II secretion system protein [Butyrivibrio sp. MC2013]
MRKMMQEIWKMQQKRKEEGKDNRGFSLVELIIVIAIMAVLVAVLAPQFLQYVERSRNSTDSQNATAIVNVVQAYAADQGSISTISGESITVGADGYDPGDAGVKDALEKAGYTTTSIKCQSRSNWTEYKITFTDNGSGGINVTYGDETDGGKKFAAYMATGTVD